MTDQHGTHGTLYGVGVGPGDPELLTLKALRLMRSAAVIAYPAPDTGSSFARDIVASHLPEGVREYAIRIPMQTDRFPIQAIYDDAAAALTPVLESGEDVVVLCEGDPFFYGSFMYLHARLATDFPCQVVPGVSSLMAGGAVSARPLASLSETFAVVPAPLPAERLSELLDQHDNLVFLKVGRHLDKVRRVIASAGLTDRAIYMERIATDRQRCLPLAELTDASAPYFSLIQLNKRGSKPV